MKSNLVLIGFMGCGKSTVAKILEKSLEMKLIDIDKEVEIQEKCSIRNIFEKKGEEEFRRIESRVVEEFSKKNNIIISTGGGVILDEKNIENLGKDGLIIYLDVDRKVLYNRLKNSSNRPLLDGEGLWERINTTLDTREELYKKSAHYNLEIADESIYEVADMVKKIYIEKG